MDKINKSVYEKLPIYVNFSNDLADGENLTSFSISCINVDNGKDFLSTIVASSSQSASVVTVVLQAGVLDSLYMITVIGSSDLGNEFEKEVYVEIVKTISGEFSKQPGDEFIIKLDFEEDLRFLSGETISSASTSIVDENGDDWSGTIISGGPSVDGNFIYLALTGGVEGIYEIYTSIISSGGYVFDIFVLMEVEER